MHYKDFDLKLDGGREQGYSVEVVSSPIGRRSVTSPLVLRAGAGAGLSDMGGGWRVAPDCPRALGESLFESLFPTPIRHLWERSEQSLAADDIMRLRLDVRAPELAALPWESIHDGLYHLALSPRRPVVRFSFDRPEVYPDDSRGPLNILLALSTPSDAPALAAAEEELEVTRARLNELQAAGKVGRVEVLRGASMRKLQHELRQPFHVLHYVGHGEFSQGAGHLVLEDDEGRARRVSATTLSYFFRGTALRLLFLNACRTASVSMSAAPLGVAHAALAAGVPAVVAMQDVVRDDAAALFAREFYQALAEGRPLETCVAEGRKAILPTLPPESLDWAIPVLFSNAHEGLLWKTPDAKQEAEAQSGGGQKDDSQSEKSSRSKYKVSLENFSAGQMSVGDGVTMIGTINNNREGGAAKKKN